MPFVDLLTQFHVHHRCISLTFMQIPPGDQTTNCGKQILILSSCRECLEKWDVNYMGHVSNRWANRHTPGWQAIS